MNNGVDIICDICPNVKMSLTKTVGTKQSGKQYRMRWFKCPVCGMSDLIKPIEHKGEKFIPMKKIAIYNPNNVEYLIECVVTGLVEYIVLRQLIEWHFDLFDGIKNNEAIDVNTLEENPYK